MFKKNIGGFPGGLVMVRVLGFRYSGPASVLGQGTGILASRSWIP